MSNIELQELADKIERICLTNKLEFEFETTDFPIIATVNRKSDDQLNVLDDDYEVQTGQMQLVFGDELYLIIDDNLAISEDLLNKLKNNIKKLHYLWLQEYFKQQKQRQPIGGEQNDK